MKKSILTFLLLTAILVVNGQALDNTNDSNSNKNEIKANGLYLVIGIVDFTYERLLNEESAIGLNIAVPYDKEIKDDLQYYVSPYYRFYFGKKYAAGFFLEGFGMLNSTDIDFNFFVSDDDREYVTDFALGIGLGGKWVTNGGFIGEVNFGVSRNLFKSEETDFDFISKFGISLGYRFQGDI
ncbi:DUF3575 domain-containing protein [Winogradskyella sp.]|uniref:DUF3575 domain-containing protein n=1 Tax=Winogradskyella sp. TaxID=1883156 RepID=UPI003F6BAC2F